MAAKPFDGRGIMTPTLPRALLFDVFGTTVDWFGSVSRKISEVSSSVQQSVDSAGLTLNWRRAYYSGMAKVISGKCAWHRVDQIHREALDELLPRYELDCIDSTQRDDLNQIWHCLDPWPDSRSGLTKLRQNHYVATLSNGNLDLLIDLARHGNLQWDTLFCSDLFQHFKPDAETYLGACRLLALQPAEVMMVACHRGDLDAAASYGLCTAFVTRTLEYGGHEKADHASASEYDYVATDFIDLARQLEAA
jgi:2-haloacid dehalogenase